MNKNKLVLFLGIFLFLIFFRGSFHMFFFADDFAFLQQSTITSVRDFLGFFNPLRSTFYRPLSTEVFYSFINALGQSIFIPKLIVFTVFLGGVGFFYRILEKLSGNQCFATISTILYAFHFSHVYQLYWFATFQEVSMLFFSTAAFYFLLQKRSGLSLVLFTGALLSKEQALLYPVLAFGLMWVFRHKDVKKHIKYFIGAGILSVGAFFMYLQGLSGAAELSQYSLSFHPLLVLRNILWYSMWSMGLPSAVSTLFTKFIIPLPEFFGLFNDVRFGVYMYGLLGWFALTFVGVLFVRKNVDKGVLVVVVALLALFLVSLAPSLIITHSWMVRLTIPLLFITPIFGWVLTQAFESKGVLRKVAPAFIGVYLIYNYFGVLVHEDFSTYKLETRITKNAQDVFSTVNVENGSTIYFTDDELVTNTAWNGSEKLKTSFSDQSFLDFYFPEVENVRAVYEYEGEEASEDAILVPASSFF